MQHISNGFCHVTFSSHPRMDILKVGAIFVINKFFKEIWLILHLPINFSYTVDARFVKQAFMIHLSILIMAMYKKAILVSEFIKNIFVILLKNTNSLL